MFFENSVAQSNATKKNKEEASPWYVMVSNQEIPVEATIYKPTSYLNEQRTAEQLQKDLKLCQQMTGIEVFNFSPERLALHETILALSLYNQWSAEEEFEQTTHQIYEEKVKPFIAANQDKFIRIVQEQTAEVVQLMQNTSSLSISNTTTAQRILAVQQSFDGILSSNRQRYEKLDTKIKDYNASKPGAGRPTFAERQDHKRLADLISNAVQSRNFIIEQTVVAQLVQQKTTQLLRTMLFEQQAGSPLPLLRDEELAKQYKLKPKTFYTNAERRSVLITGGPASGKGRVTDQQRKAYGGDILDLNPDLYKKLLLPLGNTPAEIKMHGSLTHNESSMVFDNLIEYWGKLAAGGHAPHTLIDVARAGNWIRGKLSVGTHIEVHSPLLSALEALKRSFDRGTKTGRFAPTAMLIQAHRDQVAINLGAMCAGCDFTFYDTSIGFNETMPVIAQYVAKDKKLDIFNVSVMMEYFQKADLRVTAVNESSLWGHTPKSTISHVLTYADHMSLQMHENKEKIADLHKDTKGRYILQVVNWKALEKQLGTGSEGFLQGLIENKVEIQHTSTELADRILAIEERLRSLKPDTNSFQLSQVNDFNESKCINTACKLIEQGTDYVRNTHNLWVYTPPTSIQDFNKEFPKGLKLVKTTESGDDAKGTTYQPGNQITFDTREFKTIEECERAIALMRQNGEIQSQHITMSSHVSDNYLCSETTLPTSGSIQSYTALPKKVRAILVDNPDSEQIASTHGKTKWLRPRAWIKCSEEHLDALTQAVKQFRAHPEDPGCKMVLLQAVLGNLYSSGPFNIEDGYDYFVSQTALREVMGRLIQKPSCYKNRHTDEKFIGVKLDAPLTLSRNERAETGCYLMLAEKDREVLSKALTMMETGNLDLDKIPGLHMLTEDNVRRTYCSDASTIEQIGLQRLSGDFNGSTNIQKTASILRELHPQSAEAESPLARYLTNK